MKVSGQVKRKAEDDITQKPSKLINRELALQTSTLSTITKKDIKYIRNSISRKKLSLAPKLPQSSSELQNILDNLIILTVKNENFVLVNNKIDNMVIFSCKSNLEFMCAQDTFFMDGTFDYCPKYFMQLFTIHAYNHENNHYVPVVFCLLKNKLAATYKQLFRELKIKCQDFSIQWNPKQIVIDYEKAIHNGVLEIFPEAEIIGCRFHLAQSWMRKIQQFGLVTEYKDVKSDIGKWLRYLFGLTFLEPEEVGDVFCFEFAEDKPVDTRLTQFADYVTETYIDENAIFPPYIWAAKTASLSRTTNTCESFHSRFRSYCSSPHSNIYVFIEALNHMQIETYVKINSVRAYEKKNEKRSC